MLSVIVLVIVFVHAIVIFKLELINCLLLSKQLKKLSICDINKSSVDGQ